MGPKSAIVIFSTYFSLQTVFVLCAGENEYDYKNGVRQIIHGKKTPGEKLLYFGYAVERNEHNKDYLVIGRDFCYPNTGKDNKPNEDVEITRYEIKNTKKAANSGVAFQQKSGVGQNQVCFYLKTVNGGEFNYSVRVYGFRKRPNWPIGKGEVKRQPRNGRMWSEAYENLPATLPGADRPQHTGANEKPIGTRGTKKPKGTGAKKNSKAKGGQTSDPPAEDEYKQRPPAIKTEQSDAIGAFLQSQFKP